MNHNDESPKKKNKIDTNNSKINELNDETICINTIRMLSADQPTAGKSGHPGAPIGCAPMVHVLYKKIMKYNPNNPKWFNRDRFVLSNGHACALLYSILYLTGYDLPLQELKNFRQYGSKCPGHPENTITPGVELTTGPLGQGIANAVGLAIAEKHLATEFNKDNMNIVDHYTYCIVGDGCLQEGISSEASSLAGHLGLGKLIVLYDDNKITIDGNTNLSFTEDVLKRYESYNWHVQSVEDGNYDHKKIYECILNAKLVQNKPSLIKITTSIGLHTSLENTAKVHGAPLTQEDLKNTKIKFGLKDCDTMFNVPLKVKEYYDNKKKGQEHENNWKNLFNQYSKNYPELAKEFLRRENRIIPLDLINALPTYKHTDKPMATRKLSEICLNAIAGKLPELMGGSADLTPSNLTKIKNDFQANQPNGNYIRYGVREHAMAAISNGLYAHGLIIPFCATFLNFLSYNLPSIRLACISHFKVLFIATHDSIFLGEDGPTHQPIEMLHSLRLIPHLNVFRPADGNEVSGSYYHALTNKTNSDPSVIVLTRQDVPNLYGSNIDKVGKGAYVIQIIQNGKNLLFENNNIKEDTIRSDIILIGTGSEVSLAIDAAMKIKNQMTIKIVSMPCMELFEKQSLEYKKSIFTKNVPILSIEAGSTFGWSKYSHVQFGLNDFGQSGSIEQLKDKFQFTTNDLIKEINNTLNFYGTNKKPHDIFDFPKNIRKL